MKADSVAIVSQDAALANVNCNSATNKFKARSANDQNHSKQFPRILMPWNRFPIFMEAMKDIVSEVVFRQQSYDHTRQPRKREKLE